MSLVFESLNPQSDVVADRHEMRRVTLMPRYYDLGLELELEHLIRASPSSVRQAYCSIVYFQRIHELLLTEAL